MTKWSEFEIVINNKLNEIFENTDYHNLSLYERRKKVYDYLYNSLSFDFDELEDNSKDVDKQLRDVLFNNKGICNSISYVYKIMLEKAGVYSMVLFCKDEDDDHTIVLVDNGDGTLSFDDVSIAVYSKTKTGIMTDKESRFDYDFEDAKAMQQGINDINEKEKYLIFQSKVVNYLFGKDDDDFMDIKPPFVVEDGSFSNINSYVRSYKRNQSTQRM